MFAIRLLIAALIGAACLPAGAMTPEPEPEPEPGPEPASTAADPHAVVRGMTVSCPRAGQIWGTDAMVATMAELRDLGVNWITIHPYASIRGDGTVGGSRGDGLYRDPTWLTRPIREAHALGLKIMIKPHLAYWGSPFSWRGEIAFREDAAWERFFTTYERWITMVAELSVDADAFVVGTELGGTVHHEQAWRRIIRAVRERTIAPLSYAANWDRFEEVAFWDALDAIGIQSYFPLVDHADVPSEAELDAAWGRVIERLERYGRAHRRPIVLAELGYNRSERAAIEPWAYETHRTEKAELIQRRCLDAALRAVQGSEVVAGAFLWKWFPGSRRRRGNFIMSSPAMVSVISEAWRREAAGDRAAPAPAPAATGTGVPAPAP